MRKAPAGLSGPLLPVSQVQNYHAKISELEEELLQRLSNCENLLEDGDLLNILARTKQTVQVGAGVWRRGVVLPACHVSRHCPTHGPYVHPAAGRG